MAKNFSRPHFNNSNIYLGRVKNLTLIADIDFYIVYVIIVQFDKNKKKEYKYMQNNTMTQTANAAVPSTQPFNTQLLGEQGEVDAMARVEQQPIGEDQVVVDAASQMATPDPTGQVSGLSTNNQSTDSSNEPSAP